MPQNLHPNRRRILWRLAAPVLQSVRRFERTNPFKRVELNHYTCAHPNVDAGTEGMKLAHLTDLHYGPWIRTKQVETLVQCINAQEVDLVVLTGDYVGHRTSDIAPCIRPMHALTSPAIATLGNHDHLAGSHETQRVFASIGVPVLSNTATVITSQRGHTLTLVGIDDAFTRHHDIAKAFKGVDTQTRFCLTLSHVPEIAPEIANRGADLILSGHTHGLQVDTPAVRALARRAGMHLVLGAYPLDNSLLYVSQGLGSDLFPWRYRTRPEIALFTLRHAPTPSLTLNRQQFVDLVSPDTSVYSAA